MMLASFLDDLSLAFVIFVAVMIAGLHSLKKSARNIPADKAAKFCGAVLGHFLRNRSGR